MLNRYRMTLVLCVALGFSSAVAHADSGDSAAAQALFDQAKKLMADGHLSDACPKLEESQRLDPRSGTLINLASCYEKTGRLASAWSKYIEAATSAKAAGNSERESVARERAAALAPKLPKLVIVVPAASKTLPGLELSRDNVAVGQPSWGLALPIDAGEHEVTAKAPGHEPFQTKVTVASDGSTTTVAVPELALTTPGSGSDTAASNAGATPAKPSSGPSRAAALVAGGIGVVGVGVGAVFGLM